MAQFGIDLDILVGGKGFDIFMGNSNLRVAAPYLNGGKSVVHDPTPLLGKGVVKKIRYSALSGSILSDQDKAVFPDRNVYCPVAPVEAFDLELSQRRRHKFTRKAEWYHI